MKNNNRYFGYLRRSLDLEDKQVQSLSDQRLFINKKSKELGVNIVEIFEESMSAKKPWRFRFNEMIQRIEKWEAKWILCWEVSRLTRNPIDAGTIQFMLQNWTIKSIVTNSREYKEVDAWLLFSVETWMSNQFLLDLKKNVKRGMDSKTDKWDYAWRVPEWYLNVKLNKTITTDPNNFLLVRKMWDLMLTWNYSVPRILDIAHEEWGYRRAEDKIRNNETDKISLSWLYKMFSNPFYTWKFMWLWELRNGNHKAMITFKEYQHVQKLLGKKWRTICAKTKEFSYTWMIQCWECGWSITATEKIKKIKSTWEIKNYIYYHCTKKKIWNSCKQKPIRIEDLEEQINIVLDSIEIIPEFKQWWLDLLKKDYNIQVEQNKKIQASIRKKISENEIRLHRLTDLLLDESIDKKEYNIRKSWLRIGLIELNESLQNIINGTNDSTDLTERLFDIIINIQEKFNTWTLLDKKTLFSCLGENSVLLDWVLAIWTHPWIKPIENKLPNIKRNYDRLELTKKGISFSETNTLNGVIWEWYSHGELNSGPSLEKAVS